MTNVLRVSESASLGLHTMGLLASRPDELMSIVRIAEVLSVSEATLSKVMQRLVHAGQVQSVRGPRGGFRLPRGGEGLSLLAVFEAIEGPLGAGHCLLGRPECPRADCVLGKLIADVNAEVRTYLAQTKLSDLKASFLPLEVR